MRQILDGWKRYYFCPLNHYHWKRSFRSYRRRDEGPCSITTTIIIRAKSCWVLPMWQVLLWALVYWLCIWTLGDRYAHCCYFMSVETRTEGSWAAWPGNTEIYLTKGVWAQNLYTWPLRPTAAQCFSVLHRLLPRTHPHWLKNDSQSTARRHVECKVEDSIKLHDVAKNPF